MKYQCERYWNKYILFFAFLRRVHKLNETENQISREFLSIAKDMTFKFKFRFRENNTQKVNIN